MSGRRLLIGIMVMGLIVPGVLYFLLKLEGFTDFFTVSATCFLAWCIADLTATILSHPRLKDRSPGKALREWEKSKSE